MKRVPLSSSVIAAVTYDQGQKTLEVEFRDGDIYCYTHVRTFVCQELLKAESAGAFWNQVKDNYKFARIRLEDRKR